MLTFVGKNSSRDCTGSTRRDFLRIGGLGAAGFTLGDLLRTKALAREQGSDVKNKTLWPVADGQLLVSESQVHR